MTLNNFGYHADGIKHNRLNLRANISINDVELAVVCVLQCCASTSEFFAQIRHVSLKEPEYRAVSHPSEPAT
jgi:hypothetical protein